MDQLKHMLICSALLVVGMHRALAIGPRLESGEDARYWQTHSVVYARLNDYQFADGYHYLDLLPMGTVAGGFDAATSPRLRIKTRMENLQLATVPRRGGAVLVVLRDADVGRNYSGAAVPVPGTRAAYMPGDHVPIVIDETLREFPIWQALRNVQEMRRETPINPGKGADYWRNHSLVFARIEMVRPARGNSRPHVVLAPLGTLSGLLDAGPADVIVLEWDHGFHSEASKWRPEIGDRVLVVVQASDTGSRYKSPGEMSAYMPGIHESFHIVKSFSDPDVEATLKSVQGLRSGDDK